jgi:hypothetical protein
MTTLQELETPRLLLDLFEHVPEVVLGEVGRRERRGRLGQLFFPELPARGPTRGGRRPSLR